MAFVPFQDFHYINEERNEHQVDTGCDEHKRACPKFFINREERIPANGNEYKQRTKDHQSGNGLVSFSLFLDEFSGIIAYDHVYNRWYGTQQTLRIKCHTLTMIQVIITEYSFIQISPGVGQHA